MPEKKKQTKPVEQPQKQQKKNRYEIFQSNNGKPSACKWVGSISALVCLALFVAIIIFYMVHVAEGAIVLQILDKIIEVFGISAGLLGLKSISSSIGGNRVTIQNTTNSDGTQTRTRTMSKRYGGAGGGYEDDEEIKVTERELEEENQETL